MFLNRQFGLITIHCGLYQLAGALAGGFIGAYLLKMGYSLTAALLAYAALLALRFLVRFVSLAVVRRFGFHAAFMLGAGLAAVQFPILIGAGSVAWLWAWIVIVSVAESLYWPVYHCASATAGGGARRGRELGTRTAVVAIVGVIGPLAGGFLLGRFPPAVDFSIAAALVAASLVPVAMLDVIPAGPVPRARDTFALVDRLGAAIFAAEGFMSSGLVLAWPMVLFSSLGSHYETLGLANAAAGVVGAVTGLVCGRGLDRGHRRRYLAIVTAALTFGFALRLCASWSPAAATIANLSGAAITGLYMPVLMSVVYDRAKRSGEAYRFHFAAEAGWDSGAVLGCVAASAVVWATGVASLALLPGVLGVPALYVLLGRHTPADAVRHPDGPQPQPVPDRQRAA